MASTAPIMGAPAGAPFLDASLSQFEAVACQLERIAAVLSAAGEEIEPGGMTQRGVLLVSAAEDILTHTVADMSTAVATAYRERH